MDAQLLVIWLVIGAIAGWLAGLVVSGTGFGIVGDIIIGIIGSIVAGFLFPRLGVDLGGGAIATIIASAIGAIVLLVIAKAIRRAT